MSVDSLYKFHAKCLQDFDGGPKYNWMTTFECQMGDLRDMTMEDVREEAALWRSQEVPPNFYFTHGQYFRDGVKHIIQELTEKPTSHRALYSLIAQKDISNSGDSPIPSFLTFQCQIVDGVLYCTAHFRALEISRFFQINLEEIRQTIVEISNNVPAFTKVNLTIFAFRAYVDKKRGSLKRPSLEVMPEWLLLTDLVEEAPDAIRNLDTMLKELKEAVTAVSPTKLMSLKGILTINRPGVSIRKEFRDKLFLEKLTVAIEAATRLEQLRRKQSHGEAVETATKHYQSSIEGLRGRLNV